MVPLETAFLGLVIFFGFIGGLRGWARELLAVFSVILARFIEVVLVQYVPFTNPEDMNAVNWFYLRLAIFIFIIFFGYATPVALSSLGAKARKDKFQDTLLGFFIGFINGFLVVGMLWGFLHESNYTVWGITAPTTQSALTLVKYLPITWLKGPLLLIGVAVSFAFVLIVFV